MDFPKEVEDGYSSYEGCLARGIGYTSAAIGALKFLKNRFEALYTKSHSISEEEQHGLFFILKEAIDSIDCIEDCIPYTNKQWEEAKDIFWTCPIDRGCI